MNIIVHELGKAHFKENRTNALNEGLHGMASTRSGRGRFERDIKGAEFSGFPVVTLEQFGSEVGDDKLLGKRLFRNGLSCVRY